MKTVIFPSSHDLKKQRENIMGSARATADELCALQRVPSRVRCFCVMGHIDHGKTTLADGLISSNGIISSRLAGKLRYLDSTPGEQLRGITMKSSAISLLYELRSPFKGVRRRFASSSPSFCKNPVDQMSQKNEVLSSRTPRAEGLYLMNLIDSPGHIDFSSDVSTASRLCDSGIVVVDVIEGVSPQTLAVLRQAWSERMRPLLVLNKLDRLLSELQLTPLEAWLHLTRVMENINAAMASLVVNEGMGSAENNNLSEAYSIMEERWTFHPEEGEVVFASALDGWGFSIGQFSRIWAKKLEAKPASLRQMMWGPYVYHSKTKKVSAWTHGSEQKPMFVSMILDPIWQVYDAAMLRRDLKCSTSMAEKLDLDVPLKELRSTDPRGPVQAIMRRWLPVSEAVLRMAVEMGPSPLEAQSDRIQTLWPCYDAEDNNEGPKEEGTPAAEAHSNRNAHGSNISSNRSNCFRNERLRVMEGIRSCDVSENSPVVVFVSKMVPVDEKDVLGLNGKPWRADNEPEEDDEKTKNDHAAAVTKRHRMIAFARILSGVVTTSTNLYVLPRNHTGFVSDDCIDDKACIPSSPSATSLVSHLALFVMMGDELVPVSRVPAGNILGIAGLESYVTKFCTLSSTLYCPALKPITLQLEPLLRVAVEPENQKDMSSLEEGLQKLYQADPAVEVSVTARGEHIVACLGELHLEQCVKDLSESYAKGAKVRVSPPLVQFRESVLCPPQVIYYSNSQLASSPQPQPSGSVSTVDVPGQLKTPPWSDEEGLNYADPTSGRARIITQGGDIALTVGCLPLGDEATNALIATSPDVMRLLLTNPKCHEEEEEYEKKCSNSSNQTLSKDGKATTNGVTPPQCIGVERLREVLELQGRVRSSDILSFGPRNCGPNVLVQWKYLKIQVVEVDALPPGPPLPIVKEVKKSDQLQQKERDHLLREYSPEYFQVLEMVHNGLITGFQLATSAGPLAGEELHGVFFFLENIEISAQCLRGWSSLNSAAVVKESRVAAVHMEKNNPNNTSSLDESSSAQPSNPFLLEEEEVQRRQQEELHLRQSSRFGPLSGQLIFSAKLACRASFLCCPVRLVESFYRCTLQCDQFQLGNMYAVLGRRRGRVTSEDVLEGTPLFLLEAVIPVVESFGFANELLKRTSGAATAPQLSFSHWETMSMDPFWRPQTEEEREDEGEGGHLGIINSVRKQVDSIRKRKGLSTAEKLIVAAEKQRTMSLKK